MRLLIEHETIYRYKQPVEFEDHRLMLMPHEGHDVSVLEFQLECQPQADVSWLHDVFGNSVAVARFEDPAAELVLRSRALLEYRHADQPLLPLTPGSRTLPLRYPASEQPDLQPNLAMRHPEQRELLCDWIEGFRQQADQQTDGTLAAINRAIRDEFHYCVRLEPGIQTPAETLERGSGTCRDFAVLMMEAARALGVAARFVSGYLYDPAVEPSLQGTGHTHAWAQIYLPGPGWVEYDPTNALINSSNLLRAAVARDPDQAAPVTGTFRGPADAARDLSVSVTVRESS